MDLRHRGAVSEGLTRSARRLASNQIGAADQGAGTVAMAGDAVAGLQHQGLIDGAHAHAFGDGVPQALVGGEGGRGHGGILAGGDGGTLLRHCCQNEGWNDRADAQFRP